MPPSPPIYLIREQVDALCQSPTFDPHKLLRDLLRFVAEQTYAGEKTTEAILAQAVWRDSAIDKTKVRAGLSNLRKKIKKYYDRRPFLPLGDSMESQTAIILISIPPAGLDVKTREFKHYRAEFSFRPEMLRSATAFAKVLHYKYELPLSEGRLWFNDGIEPESLVRMFIRKQAQALCLGTLFGSDADEDIDALIEVLPSVLPFPPNKGTG